MKKKFIAIFICLSISVFAVEKPDILENKFNKIRVVNKDDSTSTSSYQSIKLSEATREELLNNLR